MQAMISSEVCPLDFSHSISLAISLQVISSIFPHFLPERSFDAPCLTILLYIILMYLSIICINFNDLFINFFA